MASVKIVIAAAVVAEASKCCYDKDLTADQCASAADCDDESDYCSATAANCADCSGVFCSDAPVPSPEPTPSPTPVPSPPAPAGESKCCYDADLTIDQCPTASDCDGAADYCSASAGNCGDCGGVFCSGDAPAPTPDPTPSPAPVPSPPAPAGEAKCCYDADLTVDQCPTASDCDGATDYCSASSANCGDCGGVFCSGDAPGPTPVPTPVPTPPSGESKCCYDKDLTADQCSTASDCDGSSDYCSSSSDNCSDCGGVFCAASVLV